MRYHEIIEGEIQDFLRRRKQRKQTPYEVQKSRENLKSLLDQSGIDFLEIDPTLAKDSTR